MLEIGYLYSLKYAVERQFHHPKTMGFEKCFLLPFLAIEVIKLLTLSMIQGFLFAPMVIVHQISLVRIDCFMIFKDVWLMNLMKSPFIRLSLLGSQFLSFRPKNHHLILNDLCSETWVKYIKLIKNWWKFTSHLIICGIGVFLFLPESWKFP